MRTTLTIDDDVYTIACHVAAIRHKAIGSVLSELARRGLDRGQELSEAEAFPVFSVSEKAPVFGLEDVKRMEDDE
ncbi:MAG: hypothetical protein A3J97_03365 [Spirochaetes bacterium RIFOXYC1_FULL_54_7]|nr:MAG: hypothetical protein A3J97_03365 [Spirochaetes bacterium RIFOXYC1_FULL_54_7]